MQIWKNNKLEHFEQSRQFIDFQLGRGVFETILVSQKVGLILWDGHVERFKKGANFLGGQVKCDFDGLKKILREKLSEHEFYRLKLIYLPSCENVLVDYSPFKMENKNWSLFFDNNLYRGNSPHYKVKSISYLENLHLNSIARARGFDDYLITDKDGNILETTIANIFFVNSNGIIETPALKNNSLLNGTIRNYLIKNINKTNYSIIEKNINKSDLPGYNEVFISNSLRILQTVKKINNINFYDNKTLIEIMKFFKKCFQLSNI